jgi:hypothetical protein
VFAILFLFHGIICFYIYEQINQNSSATITKLKAILELNKASSKEAIDQFT